MPECRSLPNAFVWLCAAARFLLVHGPDNQDYYIAIDQITTMRAPVASDLQKAFPSGTRCIIVTTSGKFVAATETCADLYKAIMTYSPR